MGFWIRIVLASAIRKIKRRGYTQEQYSTMMKSMKQYVLAKKIVRHLGLILLTLNLADIEGNI